MAAAKKPADPRVTLATTPAYPVPGRPFRLRAETVSATSGTHVRIWCSAAPPGTKLRAALDESRASRVALTPLLRIQTDERKDEATLTLERGGGYVLVVQELQIGEGFTGGYEGDPRGAASERVRSTGVTTLYVASPLTTQLGCGNDTATLRLFVHNGTVVQTELPVHGATTPRIEFSASATARVRLAAEDTDVRAAVAALAGVETDDLVGDVGESLDDLIENVIAHFVQSGRHFEKDAANTISESFLGATTVASRATALSALRSALGRHMRNDSGSGTGTAGYHTTGDWPSLPLDAASPGDALTDAISHADTWRAYELHRLSALHKSPDNTNNPAALPPLLELHRLFLTVLAAATPETPATSQPGDAALISQLGFKYA